METKPHPDRTATDRAGVQATVDRAVKRLAVSGRTRTVALEIICDKLTDAINCLQTAGFGETSRLRGQLMYAVGQLDEAKQEAEHHVGGDYVR